MSQEADTKNMHSQQEPGKIATLTLCVLVFILNMDITIVNVALPSLSALPDATDARLQWVIASYALAASVAVIPSGALLDRYGPRRVLAIATLLFGTASLAAALSTSTMAVTLSRILMGLGSSAILTGSIATLTLHYQEDRKTRAFGFWSACAAIGLAVGPLAGGWLINVSSWKAIFLFNVPLSFFAVIAVIRTIPSAKESNHKKIDIVSISVLSFTLLTGVAALIELGTGRSLLSAAMATCCVITFAVFLIRQQSSGSRLFDDQVLRNGTMLTPLFVLVALFTVMAILLFLLPTSFELGIGNGPLNSSLYILPLPLGIATATLFGGFFLHKLSTAFILYISLTTTMAGLLIVISQEPTRPSSITLAGLTLIGVGVGIGQPVALQTAVGSFAPKQRGLGSGFVNSIRLASNAAGAAIAGVTVNLIMSGSGVPRATNSLVNGASSCQRTETVGNLASAAELCTAYLSGVKFVLVLAASLIVVAILAVSYWVAVTRKTSPVSVGKPAT